MNKMERKFGRYAIPNLMYYIVILYAVGVLVQMMAPAFYIQYLMLDARAILHGQIWRVVTFMIWPPSGSLFFNLIAIYLYYNLGMTLERVWEPSGLTCTFYGCDRSCPCGAADLHHYRAGLYSHHRLSELFPVFAFAATFPEMQFYLFFVLPIKAKYLALFDGLYFVYGFLFGGMSQRIAIVMSLLNFIVYLFMSRGSRLNPKEIRRKQVFHTQMREAQKTAEKIGRHRCAVCGRTEEDDPNLVFRYCSKCEGDYEYCQDHLYTHKHVTKGGMDPRQANSNQEA